MRRSTGMVSVSLGPMRLARKSTGMVVPGLAETTALPFSSAGSAALHQAHWGGGDGEGCGRRRHSCFQVHFGHPGTPW